MPPSVDSDSKQKFEAESDSKQKFEAESDSKHKFEADDDSKQKFEAGSVNGVVPPPSRPPIVYTSLGAFVHSFWRRFKSLWTKRFTLSLLAGQVVSLCITCTTVTT